MASQRNDALNGDYIDKDGVLVNIFGDPVRTDLDRPNDEMGKLSFGLMYDGAGNLRNANELFSGGGGVTNYNALSGKPAFNGVILASGDNTLESLKLIYTHNQNTPSNIWVVTHNLNFLYVTVQVVRATGNVIIPNITYTNANAVTLTFEESVQGTAIIRR